MRIYKCYIFYSYLGNKYAGYNRFNLNLKHLKRLLRYLSSFDDLVLKVML
jgi:hypothetical protein